MTDTLTGNGTAKTTKDKSPRPKRVLPQLPTANAGSLDDLAIAAKIDTSPTNFESLELYGLFALAADASGGIFIKVARNKFASLHTCKSDFVAGGRCYRVVL